MTNEREGSFSSLPFVCTVEELSKKISLDKKKQGEIRRVSQVHPFRIPEYYINLMDKGNPHCPIMRQAVPSIEELSVTGLEDPLCESQYSSTPSFVRKYPGRGVFLVNSDCAMYCRFCNRRRIVGKDTYPERSREETYRFIERDDRIIEVILSGGDPFMLEEEEFAEIISRLAALRRIDIFRISTRIPVVNPPVMKKGHFEALKRVDHPWVVIHINHPREITPEFIEIVKQFLRSGAILISQTVLLRGVNDCPHVLLDLFESLVRNGIKPYYLFQLDEVRGADHFKVRIGQGTKIMRFLRENATGLAIPHYALDITGGSGKIPLDHEYIKGREGQNVIVESASGEGGIYCDNGKKSNCFQCGICGKT